MISVKFIRILDNRNIVFTMILKHLQHKRAYRLIHSFHWIFGIGILVLFNSCISLRDNYLGRAEREVIIPEISLQQFAQLDSDRLPFDQRSDSILHLINQRKRFHRHLTANDINQLNATFEEQLDYDRIYNILLHRKNRRNDHLSSMEKYAGIKLLQSANRYYSKYEKNPAVRRNLNRGDIAHNIPPGVMHASRNYLFSPGIRKALWPIGDDSLHSLDSICKNLPKTNYIKSVYYRFYSFPDLFNYVYYGLFKRVGHVLLKLEPAISQGPQQRKYALQLESVLQPYDILLMKSPNLLSNEIIPGYFGHASIWFGSEIKKYGKEKFGNDNFSRKVSIHTRGMIEAVKSGVKLRSLKEYAEGKTYIVMRVCNLSDMEKKSVLKNALAQLHKNYDFNFDFESSDEVNCTKLVYLAYDFINWKVQYFMGRYTIFPDDLLSTAQENSRFEIVAILKNGKLTQNPTSEDLKQAMKD